MRGRGGKEAEKIVRRVQFGSYGRLYVSDLCRQTFSDSWDHERVTLFWESKQKYQQNGKALEVSESFAFWVM